MNIAEIDYRLEEPAHDPEIEDINAEAFGPGRFTRAAYAIREGGPHETALSFVALHEGRVVASVRLTRIAAGEGRGLLLGPLAVRPAYKNIGIGRRLVAISLEAARKAGHGVVVLVGDPPYYGPLGFQPTLPGRIDMPRPFDPRRLLACELVEGATEKLRGMMVHADRAPAVGEVASDPVPACTRHCA